jgi:hypothetical protein
LINIISYFIIFISSYVLSQDVINERYSLGYDNCVFRSVISNDSCYYITGITANSPNTNKLEGAFVRINFDSNLYESKILSNDTMSINLASNSNLIKTFDNNFAQIASTNIIGTPNS